MKRISLALSALLLAGGSAQAAESSLTIECANPRLPRMADVSAVTGIDNLGAAFAMREKLLHQATRLCHKPEVALVRFVPDPIVTEQLNAVAAR
jgi:hypothetical protein